MTPFFSRLFAGSILKFLLFSEISLSLFLSLSLSLFFFLKMEGGGGGGKRSLLLKYGRKRKFDPHLVPVTNLSASIPFFGRGTKIMGKRDSPWRRRVCLFFFF